MLNKQSNLSELYTEPSYDDLKEALKNFLNPGEESSEENTTTSKTTNTETTKTAEKSTEKVEDAFDQLFNS